MSTAAKLTDPARSPTQIQFGTGPTTIWSGGEAASSLIQSVTPATIVPGQREGGLPWAASDRIPTMIKIAEATRP